MYVKNYKFIIVLLIFFLTQYSFSYSQLEDNDVPRFDMYVNTVFDMNVILTIQKIKKLLPIYHRNLKKCSKQDLKN